MLQKLLFPVIVYAKEPVSDENKELLKANELPVYVSTDDIEGYEVVKRSPSSLENGISYVRKNVTVYVNAMQDVTNKVEENCKNVFNQTKQGYDYITDKDNSLPRAIAITSGGLIGFLFGIRGGIMKKVFYTSTGLTAASAICYPKQAAEICQNGYKWIKENKGQDITEVAGEKLKEISLKVTSKLPSMDSFDKVGEQFKNLIGSGKKVEGDVGQSHPDDKDLYATRSKLNSASSNRC
ncbi:MICOS complex subunit Mic27-like isoform X2 [Centruroides sculpturatus]|uniref:MICOS complex subunit Mic27-like isoform X2 n=1 Tax=Centruroides sculpturatus TaxID=218467 RepID=UPI000C6D8BC8|nr:MICOS complex subunit Mic27-like isoform X2 [Centruroides sculpturatus]